MAVVTVPDRFRTTELQLLNTQPPDWSLAKTFAGVGPFALKPAGCRRRTLRVHVRTLPLLGFVHESEFRTVRDVSSCPSMFAGVEPQKEAAFLTRTICNPPKHCTSPCPPVCQPRMRCSIREKCAPSRHLSSAARYSPSARKTGTVSILC